MQIKASNLPALVGRSSVGASILGASRPFAIVVLAGCGSAPTPSRAPVGAAPAPDAASTADLAAPASDRALVGHWIPPGNAFFVDEHTGLLIDRQGRGRELELRADGTYRLATELITNNVTCTRKDVESHEGTWSTTAGDGLALQPRRVHLKIEDDCDPHKSGERDEPAAPGDEIPHRARTRGARHPHADAVHPGRPRSCDVSALAALSLSTCLLPSAT